MGCCGTSIDTENKEYSSYIVQICNLIPQEGQNKYLIQINEHEEFDKMMDRTMFEDLAESQNRNILQIIGNNTFLNNSIYYIYIRSSPIIKEYNQVKNFTPYKYTTLQKIVILSCESTLNNEIPNEIVIRATENLENIVGECIDLQKYKDKYDKAFDATLSNNDLQLTDEEDYGGNDNDENESEVKGKENEVIIEDEVNEDAYNFLMKKLYKDIKNVKIANIKNNTTNDTKEKNILDDETDNGTENNKINKIIIRDAKIEDIDIFSEVTSKLIKYKNLKKFCFYNNIINTDFEGWEDITELLKNNYHIRCLDLHSSILYDIHLELIVKAIMDKRLRVLDLSENFLTSKGMEYLALFLRKNQTLQRLYLQRNTVCQFKAEGVQLVTDALMNHPNLQLIDFSFMEITGGGKYIKTLIETVSTLKTLLLRSCKLNIHDFKDICSILKKNESIQTFDISMNDMGSDKSLDEIAAVINQNRTIKKLLLDQMNLNMNNKDSIFDAIKGNNVLTNFSFNFNSGLNPKFVLNFFLNRKNLNSLEYCPFNPEKEKEKNKEFTLEEKKLIEKFKIERPGVEIKTKIE